MTRLGLVGLLFLGLCLGVYLLAHAGVAGDGTNKEPQPDNRQALKEIQAVIKLADQAERAIDSANYGEAKSNMAAVRERLNALVFVVAEQQIDDAQSVK